ncbi:MAG TPA: tripartite tricarboxylate transporter substrate-binding protein [Xanthobacteraceae bacterium]|nr:tripartite tricarboxylate transporter substrate-binding protein [Xanthobacteraceae bacterium]
MKTRRTFLQLAAATLATPALPRLAGAQAWPSKPIRAVIPFTAGSTIDIVGRIVLDPLSQQLGQPIVVENRGGAGGSIGAGQVAKSDPDGYTILVHAAAHSAAPAAYPNLSYDVSRDFAGVALFGSVPNVTVISPAKGIKTLQELVAKAKVGNMTFASAGVGSATHWAAERLRLAAGFKATHVPFRGGPEALTEVMTGRVDFMCIGISSGLPLVRDGKLLALAVNTPKRSVALPNVPTTLEAGYPNSEYVFWMGILAPAKTPRPIIDRLHAETMKALENPVVKQKFAPQGIEPMPLKPAEFDELIKKEVAANIELVKAAGLKFN